MLLDKSNRLIVDIKNVIRMENVYSLKDFGNKPAGRFILRNAKWIDMLPKEFEQMMQNGGEYRG